MKISIKLPLIFIVVVSVILCVVSITYLAVTTYKDRAEAKEAAKKSQVEAAQRKWKAEACEYGADIAVNLVSYRNRGVKQYQASNLARATGNLEKGDDSGKFLGVAYATDDEVVRYVYYDDNPPTREDTRRFALNHCTAKIFE